VPEERPASKGLIVLPNLFGEKRQLLRQTAEDRGVEGMKEIPVSASEGC